MKTSSYKDPVNTLHIHAISLLLSNDVRILDWLLSEDRTSLSSDPQSLLYESGVFSTGEQLLVQIALDLWDGSGHAKISEIICKLDSVRFKCFCLALVAFRQG